MQIGQEGGPLHKVRRTRQHDDCQSCSSVPFHSISCSNCVHVIDVFTFYKANLGLRNLIFQLFYPHNHSEWGLSNWWSLSVCTMLLYHRFIKHAGDLERYVTTLSSTEVMRIA